MEDMESFLLIDSCPGCQSLFKQTKYNGGWHKEKCQNDCSLQYEKFSIDNSNGYVRFSLQDFNVYVYIDFFDVKNQIWLYYKINECEAKRSLDNRIIVPMFNIDWNKLVYYNERWKKLVIFK